MTADRPGEIKVKIHTAAWQEQKTVCCGKSAQKPKLKVRSGKNGRQSEQNMKRKTISAMAN